MNISHLTRLFFVFIFMSFFAYTWGKTISLKPPKPLTLIFNNQKITINWNLEKDLLVDKTRYFLENKKSENSEKIIIEDTVLLENTPDFLKKESFWTVNKTALRDFLQRKNIAFQNKKISPIHIYKQNGTIKIDGDLDYENEIDIDLLSELINQSFQTGILFVQVPSKHRYPQLQIHSELQDQGIREVISVGHSNFEGSSKARVKNIRAAVSKFNGYIIKKGEIFSFNKILESVHPEDGFVRELVIKGDRTEKEYGGGVCQVSTTVFRAAFFAGLPIVKRRSHSYAVPYYKPFGLDATIYLGQQDFQFQNDSPGDLLVNAFLRKENLYFVFYGTKDSREVVSEGPFISDSKPAPSPKIVYEKNLAEGVEYQFSAPHNGFFTTWIRYVNKNGKKDTDTFHSEYRPWAAVIIRGKQKPERLQITPLSRQGKYRQRYRSSKNQKNNNIQ